MTIQNSDSSSENSEVDEVSQLREENEQLRQQLAAQQIDETDETLRQHAEQKHREQRSDQIQAKASGQVHAILTALGFDDSDRQDFIQQMGGISAFVQLDANDNAVMQISGRKVSLAEGIPQLPAVQRKINKISSADPAERLQAQIAANQTELDRLKIYVRNHPNDSQMLAKYSTLRRGTEQLERELSAMNDQPAEPSGRGYAEPDLLAERDSVEQLIKTTPVNLNDPISVKRSADLKRRRKTILAEIHRQLSR